MLKIIEYLRHDVAMLKLVDRLGWGPSGNFLWEFESLWPHQNSLFLLHKPRIFLHGVYVKLCSYCDQIGLKKDSKTESTRESNLEWEFLPNRVASRIAIYRSDVYLEKEDQWEDYISWVIEKLEKLHDVFRKRLSDLA